MSIRIFRAFRLQIAIVVLCTFLTPAYAASLGRDAVSILDTEPDRLYPLAIRSPETFPVSMQIYEGLFDLDATGQVVPRLASGWETDDYRIWRLKIRKGVYFHESEIFAEKTREVQAEDVVYSLTRFCSPESFNSFLLLDSVKGAADFQKGQAKSVEGIRVAGPYLVEIELIKPERFFMNRLSTSLVTVFPKEMDEPRYRDDVGFKIAVGTGPYRLKSNTSTEVVLVRNERYWDHDALPSVASWAFRIQKNDQTRLASLRRRQVDLMVLPGSLYATVLNPDGNLKEPYRDDYIVQSAETFNTHLIGINLDRVPGADLRRAMFWGTNRAEIIQTVLFGYADATAGAIPPGMNGYMPPKVDNLYDPDKAKAFLKKSGYRGEPIELVVHNLAGSELIGQIFQAQMAKLGIKIVLNKLDFSGAVQRVVKGETQLFSMFFEFVFSSPEPVLINLYSSSKIPVPNFFHFSDPAVDSALAELYTLPEQESMSACQRIEAKVMELAPAIFLYRQQYVVLHSRHISDVIITGNNHYLLEKVTVVESESK